MNWLMNTLTNILLGLILAFNIGVVATLMSLFFKYRKLILDFILPPEEGKPSALSLAIDVACSFLARALIAQYKGFLMGLQSGQARAEKAVKGDMAEGLIEQNPLGALLMSFPALKKTLRRNPALLDVALNSLGSRSGVSMPGNGGGESPKFNL